MKTEEQARQTRCCGGEKCGTYIFVADEEQDPMAETRGEWHHMCIASECMAWRWDGFYTSDNRKAATGVPYRPGEVEEKGYCGLAGKP